MNVAQRATHHAATCFLNSLLREWTEHRASPSKIEIPIGGTGHIDIPLRHHSVLGRHRYEGRFFLVTAAARQEIDFLTLVHHLTEFLSKRLGAGADQKRLFEERVRSSRDNIEAALAGRETSLAKKAVTDFDFLSAEQALLVGHNFHPTPKSRDEFDAAALEAYAPEFAGSFRLQWMAADPSIVFEKRAVSFADQDWTAQLALRDLPPESETQARTLLEAGFRLLPFHPWQLDVLRKSAPVREHLAEGRLKPLGVSKSDWGATSSLRSVYREDAPFMLKFSMTLKLTNSIRHLLAHEVERGLQLQDVLNTVKGREFQKLHPQFHVVTEPAFFALKDAEGRPIDASITVCRENPFRRGREKGHAVLATLAQDALYGGENWAVQAANAAFPHGSRAENGRRWFRRYLEVAAAPLIDAQANYGFLLGAHQQNLILELDGGLPVAASFRDCQGTGYSELGFANFAADVPLMTRENGNILDAKMGNALFTYYLILNSTFNVITALAADPEGAGETDLLTDLREFLQQRLELGVQDASFLSALLNSPVLRHKGNFLCALKSINENTTTDPLSIYNLVPNPLAPAKGSTNA